jgi:RNA polymerase sigma factor (sigma-70 family)
MGITLGTFALIAIIALIVLAVVLILGMVGMTSWLLISRRKRGVTTRASYASGQVSPSTQHPLTADEAEAGIRNAMQRLEPREREMLELHYGLDGGESLTLDQVAQRLAISKERARQIKDRALYHLRQLESLDS